jgi:hypothetical protein
MYAIDRKLELNTYLEDPLGSGLEQILCRMRRLNGVVLWMRPEKPRSRVTASVVR